MTKRILSAMTDIEASSLASRYATGRYTLPLTSVPFALAIIGLSSIPSWISCKQPFESSPARCRVYPIDSQAVDVLRLLTCGGHKLFQLRNDRGSNAPFE